jgi:hypothetical protein
MRRKAPTAKSGTETPEGFPFRRGSLIGQAIWLCLTHVPTEDQLRRLAKAHGADYSRLIRSLRAGEMRGGRLTWKLEEYEQAMNWVFSISNFKVDGRVYEIKES